MKKKLCALLLAAILILPTTMGVSARQTDIAEVEANRDLGVVAADYGDVGTELDPAVSLPSSYSSRDIATPVRSQQYNTCWAYSASAVLEICAAKIGIDVGYLSPMHMNYWATKRSDGTGWQRDYSAAGYPYIAMGYLTSGMGAVAETDFPASSTFSDYEENASSLSAAISASSLIFLDGTDRETVKTAVWKYGAAVGNFHYVYSFLNSDNAAYFSKTSVPLTTNQLRGHAIAIVGWDDHFSRDNFNENVRPAEDGAWLCKNSWGPGWSNIDGYFWISYEDQYLFDDRFGPSFAIAETELYDDSKKLYQNESYGFTWDMDQIPNNALVRKNNKLTFVNIFDFDRSYRRLDKIIFETLCAGAEYELSYIPIDENGIPVNDEEQWITLGSGTVDYQGYLCIDIDDYLVQSGKGGIGVTLKRTAACSQLSVGGDEKLTVGGNRVVFIPDTKKDASYVIGYKAQPVEATDLYKEVLNDDYGANFVIKAIAEETDIMGDVDLDGELTILDVTMIQRYLADIDPFSEHQKKLADYDADGEITIIDCTKIQRVLADIDEPLYPTVIT